MKALMGVLASLAILSGCANRFPDSPLAANSPEEARCAAIRENTPLQERGTSKDSTTYANSGCAPSMSYPSTGEPAKSSIFTPFRWLFDAADGY